MKSINRNNAGGVQFSFDCLQCFGFVSSDDYYFNNPEEFLAFDDVDFSNESRTNSVVCPDCESEYEYQLDIGPHSISLEVDGIDDRAVRVSLLSRDESDYIRLLADSTVNEEYFESFKAGLESVKSLLEEATIPQALRESFLKQLYVTTTTILETYLYESIKYLIFTIPKLKEEFIANGDWKRQPKIEFGDILIAYRDLDNRLSRILLETSFHDLVRAKELFFTIGIVFPEIGNLLPLILVRHHLVHRNGKNENGEPVGIDETRILDTLKKVEDFVVDLDQKIGSRMIEINDLENLEVARRRREDPGKYHDDIPY